MALSSLPQELSASRIRETEDLIQLLEAPQVKCRHLLPLFEEKGAIVDDLLSLTKEELMSWGVKDREAKRILQAARQLRQA